MANDAPNRAVTSRRRLTWNPERHLIVDLTITIDQPRRELTPARLARELRKMRRP